jgi:hypothetical protein
MPARRTQLARTKRVAPRNQTRSKKAHARNYGEEAATIRLMPCLAEGRGLARCMGPIHVAHVTARGRGGCKGGRFDQVPLCAAHHRLAGEAGTSDRAMFERLHVLDLRAEADRIALLHSEPLGLRAVARRWVQYNALADAVIATKTRVAWRALESFEADDALTGYECDALFGWVRRAMQLAEDAAGRGGCRVHRSDLAVDVGQSLGFGLLDLSYTTTLLCELAGWPS